MGEVCENYICKICKETRPEKGCPDLCGKVACESCAEKQGLCNLCGAKLLDEIEKQIQELLKKLDSDEPNEHEKATEKLIELGKIAKEIVKKAVDEHLKKAKEAKNSEVISRCERILKDLAKGNKGDERKKWGKEGTCTRTDRCLVREDINRPCERCGGKGHGVPFCEKCAKELGICAVCRKQVD
jgi:hypothetical protein